MAAGSAESRADFVDVSPALLAPTWQISTAVGTENGIDLRAWPTPVTVRMRLSIRLNRRFDFVIGGQRLSNAGVDTSRCAHTCQRLTSVLFLELSIIGIRQLAGCLVELDLSQRRDGDIIGPGNAIDRPRGDRTC